MATKNVKNTIVKDLDIVNGIQISAKVNHGSRLISGCGNVS